MHVGLQSSATHLVAGVSWIRIRRVVNRAIATQRGFNSSFAVHSHSQLDPACAQSADGHLLLSSWSQKKEDTCA
eukprot:683606-Rhodomonas_salina.1